MVKQIAALTLAASLGAGSATAVLMGGTDTARPKYIVHGVDVRVRGIGVDGGSVVGLKVYARKALPDGGFKDVGGHICPPTLPFEVSSLLTASEACIRE